MKTLLQLQEEGVPFTVEDGDVILRLRGTEEARRSWRRAAIRYAARFLREMGYGSVAASLEMEHHIRFARGSYPALETT